MTGFPFPRFGERRAVPGQEPGEFVDLYMDDADAGDEEDTLTMSADEPSVTVYRARLGAGGKARVFYEEIG